MTPTLLWKSISGLRKKKLVNAARSITRKLLNSEINNDKVNMPSFLSLKPTVSYIDDLDFLTDFEKEFSAIVYNDAVTSKLDFLTEPTIEADDQAIQTILLGIPKDIYVAVDSCKAAQEIWLRVQQMMKGSDIGIQEKKAKLFNE
nr:ribonuclease H-like domain-containing protein [Tanacetum cinerariifolium]